MKKFLSLLSLAGLPIATGCAVDNGYQGGYYGPTEVSVGVYGSPYYYNGYYYRRGYYYYGPGYWDRGRYYRRYYQY